MKFGLVLPFSDARDVPQRARLAEEAGWDGIFLGDAIWTQDPMVLLGAAAAVTSRIRLGTQVTPAPLRVPWKLASESLALDHLSGGRFTLGLGAGAVWMGWQAFPDVNGEVHARAEMLDEMIDILTCMYQREPFDYDGKHYHIQLTAMDVMHYPPRPLQQPRIPLWVVGLWPSKKSMRRVLRCDGIFAARLSKGGQFPELKPEDVREIKTYVDANRTLDTPFDIVLDTRFLDLPPEQRPAVANKWQEAGATWCLEGLWNLPAEEVDARIRQGPPGR
jgi:alkanesulfonate monooxygenase SsuD/methylene tetrahydromethanopterin reductase-like flavin-dependent oxidoreductase (luciferase family)